MRALVAVVLLSAAFVIAAGSVTATPLAGDADGSGGISAADLQSVIDGALGRVALPGADVTLDGRITSRDAVVVTRALRGLLIDSDGDGLPDVAERTIGTDPSVADSDGDGVGDGQEALVDGRDPLARVHVIPPASPTVAASVVLTGTALANAAVVVEGGASRVTGTASAQGAFSLDVPLQPNRLNRLFVTATDTLGATPPIPIDVVHDATPPSLAIDLPADAQEVVGETVGIAGRVGDTLSGAGGIDVTVNGQPAAVALGLGTNGTFERAGVPLSVGANTITVVARDALGNERSRQVSVTRVVPDGPHMVFVSGEGQAGTAGQPLPQPVTVQVLEGDGSPIPGKIVAFEVVRNDGAVEAADGLGPTGKLQQVHTDASGLATAEWSVGSTAGCGSDRLEVSSRDVVGGKLVCATTLPAPPRRISVGSGDMQVAQAGNVAPAPLVAWVSDGVNGIAGVPVTFAVAEGGGVLQGSPPLGSRTVTTDATGHASVGLRVGPAEGNTAVTATFVGNEGLPARFTVHGIASRPGAPTTFVGVAFDNAGRPVGGARCSLVSGGVTVTADTDEDGSFALSDAGAGAGHLRVDGQVATKLAGQDIPPGSFPALVYDVVVIPQARNELPAPVLLPPLDPANARTYDGTSDVLLTIEQVPGLVMKLSAGSMTRADGTVPSPLDPASVSVNVVQAEDVPMPFPDGGAPPFAWTLQPAEAKFDPPVSVEYPNVATLPPGMTVSFVSFDHATGKFEAVGTGTVSADGSVVVTDPGSGITHAGWGGILPPYAPTANVRNCLGVSARTTSGREVRTGDVLLQDGGESLRLLASVGDGCPSGSTTTWSVAPPAAGSFDGGVTTGASATVSQAPGFRSAAPSDVVVRAQGGGASARLALTVARVVPAEAKLGLAEEKDVPCAVEPSGLDPGRVVAALQDLVARVGFRVHVHDDATPVLSQPLATGVIQDLEFRAGESGGVEARLVAGDTAGTVNVTIESGGAVLYSQRVTVAGIGFIEAWSDQFPGLRVNRIPFHSGKGVSNGGGGAYPYVLMGAQASDEAHVGARLRVFGLSAEQRARLLMRLDAEGDAAGAIGSGDTVEDTPDEMTLRAWTLPPPSLDVPEHVVDYRLLAGIDTDGDGQLDADEVLARLRVPDPEPGGLPPRRSVDGLFKTVHKKAYDFYSDLFGRPATAGAFYLLPVGAHFLDYVMTFATGVDGLVGATRSATDATVRTEPPDLSHNVGVAWDAGGTGTIPRYVFPSTSDMASDVLAAPGVALCVEQSLDRHHSDVQSYFDAHPGDAIHDFTFPLQDLDGNVEDGAPICVVDFKLQGELAEVLNVADLGNTFGQARMSGTVTVSVVGSCRCTPGNGLRFRSVSVAGLAYDLYDFDFEEFGDQPHFGDLPACAACLHAGFGTLGPGGRPFFTEVELDGPLDDFPAYAFCGTTVVDKGARPCP